MRTPLAAWRAGVRWPLALIGLLAAIVVGVLICEAIGWPFLVAPMQHRLETLLDRRVVLGAGSERAAGVRIGLLGSVRVSAPSIEIGPPSWSPTPHTALARDARLKLGYLDLWRAWHGDAAAHRRPRGGIARCLPRAPRRRPRLVAVRQAEGRKRREEGGVAADVRPARRRRRPRALQRRSPAGRHRRAIRAQRRQQPRHGFRRRPLPAQASSSAQDAASASAAARAASGATSSSGIFIRAGGAAGSSKVAEGVRLAAGESGLRLKAVGQYKQLPVRIDLGTSGVLGFFADGAEAKAQPLSLRALIGRTRLDFDGTTLDPLHFTGLKGRFKLAGPSLRLGRRRRSASRCRRRRRSTPTARWSRTAASGRRCSRRRASARAGSTAPSSTTSGRRCRCSRDGSAARACCSPTWARRSARRRPAAAKRASAAATGGRVIPDKKFDLPSLRAMDANIVINVGDVRSRHRHPRAAPQHARSSAPRRRRADDRRLRGHDRAGQARRLPAARRPRQAGALDRRHAPARRRPRAVAAHQAQGRFAAVPHRASSTRSSR